MVIRFFTRYNQTIRGALKRMFPTFGQKGPTYDCGFLIREDGEMKIVMLLSSIQGSSVYCVHHVWFHPSVPEENKTMYRSRIDEFAERYAKETNMIIENR